jgi:hypothetical protein
MFSHGGFAFDISSCVHSLSMPSACCGSASLRIVYIRQPAPQFIPIAFRIAVAFRFAFDMSTFVSYFRRFDFHGFPPQTLPPPAHWFRLRYLRLRALAYDVSGCFRMVAFGFAFDLFGCVHLPSMSSVWFRYSSALGFQEAPPHSLSHSTASFSIVVFSTSGVVSYRSAFHVFSFTQPVPFSIPGRSELRPQGRGVGHADKTKQQKTTKQKKQKQKKKKKNRNNCDAAKAQSLDAPLHRTKLSTYCRYQRV